MYKTSVFYDRRKSDKCRIEETGGAYSLFVGGEKVSENFDRIFTYGRNLFVLVSGGKFGAVQYDYNLNKIWSMPCVYDTLDEYWHDLVFSKENEVIYYNAVTKNWTKLRDLILDERFVYGEDEKNCLIIERSKGKLIWREDKNNAKFVDKPCFAFCGTVYGNPLFFDVTNGDYIAKMPDGYARQKKPYIVKPIIVNGKNIVNISESNGKLGIIDFRNGKSISPGWDEVKIELKITLKSGNDTISEVFDVSDIKSGDHVPLKEW